MEMIQEDWFKKFYGDKDFFDFVGFKSNEETKKEVDFIINAISLPPPAKILDLCCGYGRHSIMLAKLGYKVVGVDLSDLYLKIAEKKAKKEGVKIEFIKSDMRELPFKEKFDAVINMFTSFGFFDDKQNMLVLKNAADALKPSGKFLLDVENKYYFILNNCLKNRYEWKISEDKIALISNNYDVENEREIMEVNIYKNGKLDKKCGYNIRMHTLPELIQMLNKFKMHPYKIYGNYDCNPFSLESKRMIVVSSKT